MEEHQRYDPHDIGAQEAAEAQAADVARLQRDRDVDDLKFLLSHKQGRRFMWRLLSQTGVFHNPHRVAEPDPYNTAYRCGMQNIGQQLMAEIHSAAPEKYSLMMKDANA